jgi:transitional endoplasmic reticulum ATPase
MAEAAEKLVIKTKTKNPFKNIDVPVEHSGKAIILPADPAAMTLDLAIETLERKREEENKVVELVEPIEAFPWDGAQAFFKAMRVLFGWGQAVKTPPKHFFDPGSEPKVISVECGYKETMEVMWGSFRLPGIKGELECETTMQDGRLIFCLQGQVRRKYLPQIRELFELTRKLVDTDSIYRGKAFKLVCDAKGNINWGSQPKFLNTKAIRPEELIFSDELSRQVEINLFTPVRHTEFCKRTGIPLKRGVLLEGPYGTGKTLTATVAAKICEEYNWTFIHIENGNALKTALEFAKLYQPAMVFCEDIDRVTGGDRNAFMDMILNTLDGVTGKDMEIVTVLTTNNIDGINPAMLRPGRLDAVIPLRAPDEKAAQALIKLYARGRLQKDADLSGAGKALEGQIPAVIREVVERAKLYAISREQSEKIHFNGIDIELAAKGMTEHLAVLNRDRTRKMSIGDELVHTLREALPTSTPEAFKQALIEGLDAWRKRS